MAWLEKEWFKEYHNPHFDNGNDIDQLTGFILRDGRTLSVPEKSHAEILHDFEDATGWDEEDYIKKLGNIRIRPGRVFLFLDIPWDSVNIEIQRKPTKAQFNTLCQIRGKVYYDFWKSYGKEWDSMHCYGGKAVSARQFLEDVQSFWFSGVSKELRHLIDKTRK